MLRIATALLCAAVGVAHAAPAAILTRASGITQAQYDAYSEASKFCAISYCEPVISAPFQCASGYCAEFPTLTFIQNINSGAVTGLEGFIARDDSPTNRRIIVAFRGSYNLMNALVDLEDVLPVPYVPYGNNACTNCTAGYGFLSVWNMISPTVIGAIKAQLAQHPGYRVYVTGHSLGGAIAALAGVELYDRGLNPLVYTFGEPRTWNAAGAAYVDARFAGKGTFARITHHADPVPRVPFQASGYKHHAGEVYISSDTIPPPLSSIRACTGDEDPTCIDGDEFNPAYILTQHLMYFRALGICIAPTTPRI